MKSVNVVAASDTAGFTALDMIARTARGWKQCASNSLATELGEPRASNAVDSLQPRVEDNNGLDHGYGKCDMTRKGRSTR